MFKELLSWPGTLTIQTRECTPQIILLGWAYVPCGVIIKRRIMPLKRFLNKFSFCYEPLTLPLDLYILSTGYVVQLHSDMEIERTLPESETVDHPRQREEKIQNTGSHNIIKLEQPTQLERTIKKNKDSTQNTTKV